MTFVPPSATHHLERLRREAPEFGAVTEEALTRRVPACPDWTVRDLIEHVGMIHGWVVGNVGPLAPMREQVDLDPPGDDAGLLAWVHAQAVDLLDVLDRTDPTAAMWTHLGAGTADYWFRRMAHETGVHLIDLRDALEEPVAVTPLDAADGVDEFLHTYATARDRHGHVRGRGERLVLRASDIEATWLVTSETKAGRIERVASAPDDVPVVEAPALELLRMVWGRGTLAPSAPSDDDPAAALMVGRLRRTAI